MVPLLVLMALKPKARNPRGVTIDELFTQPPQTVGPRKKAPHQKWSWFLVFRAIDAVLRALEPWFPRGPRRRAIAKAVAFVTERLNGEDGLGAIFPAMANSVLMFDVLGYPADHPEPGGGPQVDRQAARRQGGRSLLPALRVAGLGHGLVCHALLEVGTEQAVARAGKGLAWLKPLQVLETKGDWVVRRPDIRPGGWAFQYANPHYPDLDDTAVVVMAMDRVPAERRHRSVRRRDRARPRMDRGHAKPQRRLGRLRRRQRIRVSQQYPVRRSRRVARSADRGRHRRAACRCWRNSARSRARRRSTAAIDYLRRTQLADGSWYGRWGMNYIYGTWSVLCALNAAGVDHSSPMIRKAVDWLNAIQNSDGGWGEDGTSYKLDYRGYEPSPSTASQTAWALIGLMAVGESGHTVERGVAYLAQTQGPDGFWDEPRYTATGFPRVFYLRYHGYAKFFPLWALARYRNLQRANRPSVAWGM